VGSVFTFDDFVLDVDRSELHRGGVPVKVDALIMRLLEVFVRSPGKLITKSELVSFAWDRRVVSDNSLTVAIWRLRKILEETYGAQDTVLTVHGRGYRFCLPSPSENHSSRLRHHAPAGPRVRRRSSGAITCWRI
jgi:DNA-binding winged helix-turn-helix (wHTH) protein